MLQKREALKKFFYEIRECRSCRLGDSRLNFVFGSGNADAKIMFVGEAPGKNEDLQGKPFVGQAGRILDELLLLIGFERKDVFIANVLKCRPPQNRDPKLDEINSCKNYLFRQIQIINPLILCTLGRHSTQLLLKTDKNITGLRGRVFKTDKHYIMPINHPAAVLYMPSRMEILKKDFFSLKKILDLASGQPVKDELKVEQVLQTDKTSDFLRKTIKNEAPKVQSTHGKENLSERSSDIADKISSEGKSSEQMELF